MELAKNLAWRYATKKFDNTKKVSDQDIEKIKEAVQLSASSYGLQLYKVLIITNPEIKAALLPHSYSQSQIVDCSHLFVFCSHTDAKGEDVDAYITHRAAELGVSATDLSGYGDYMKGALGHLSAEQKNIWLQKQTYIALGNLLSACAELKIDACPMEGFVPAAYNEVLDLDTKGLHACLVASVGYRSSEDATQHYKKVRKPSHLLFEEVK